MPTYTVTRQQRMTIQASSPAHAIRISRTFPAWTSSRPEAEEVLVPVVSQDGRTVRRRIGDVEVDVPVDIDAATWVGDPA